MNISEKSLNEKIKNLANSLGAKDVNRVRTILVLERIVARLRASKFLDDKLIFCGGFVLLKEQVTDRFTMDVDMISNSNKHKEVIEEIKQAMRSDLGDGFWFDDPIIDETQEDIHYGGIRLRPLYKIGTPFPSTDKEKNKLRRVKLDLSFQNLDFNIASDKKLKSELSELDSFSWKIYPYEYMASDKIHAILVRVGLSTRGKDVYDLSFILPKCDKKKLRSAISDTFSKRGMEMTRPIHVNLKEIDNEKLKESWNNIDSITEKKFDQCWNEIVEYFENF